MLFKRHAKYAKYQWLKKYFIFSEKNRTVL
jgi:hypothetical protein